MTEQNIIERVAAGLRCMGGTPDFFLFIPTEEVPLQNVRFYHVPWMKNPLTI